MKHVKEIGDHEHIIRIRITHATSTQTEYVTVTMYTAGGTNVLTGKGQVNVMDYHQWK